MTSYHVCTYHKCGSNWFRRLFRKVATIYEHNIWVNAASRAEINQSVDAGAYTTLRIYRNARRRHVAGHHATGEKIVLCVRDPKDALVSQYWSWRKSHKNNSDKILASRDELERRSVEDGFLFLLREVPIPYMVSIETWADRIGDADVHVSRYEGLLEEFEAEFARALDFIGFPVTPVQSAEIRDEYAFSRFSNRAPGEEDVESHYRKGVAGDWKNYFTPAVAEAFNARYGELCERLGYSAAVLEADRA